jgi:hypothetical protein
LAQDGSGAWATHYIFNASGLITDQADWNYTSQSYAWDPVNQRVYFFRDNMSPRDLHYEDIDQLTGQIIEAGETPYHGDLGWQGPIRVSPDGRQVLLGSGAIFNHDGLTSWGSLSKAIRDAHWVDNLLVTLDTTDGVEIRSANTRDVLQLYQYPGEPIGLAFGLTESYLVHVLNGVTTFQRLPFFDQDGDSMPRWWEQLYGLSDANGGDANGDPDADGVGNATEFANHSRPNAADSDADGLTDQQEIVTWTTAPDVADSDGDGLNDYAEVTTHQSDPWIVDTDNDGYTDFDEVLYGGDPTDSTGLPQPMTTFSQNFEGSPNLAAWSTPLESSAPWAVDSAEGHTGTASFKSGSIGYGQLSIARFRGVFAAGQFRFWARVTSNYCCNRMYVVVDDEFVYVPGGTEWSEFTLPITAGIHEIEFRYENDSGNGSMDAAWIDDITFAP